MYARSMPNKPACLVESLGSRSKAKPAAKIACRASGGCPGTAALRQMIFSPEDGFLRVCERNLVSFAHPCPAIFR